MRILQVNTFDQGGGAAGSAWNLFQAYRSLGHFSRLAVGRKWSDDPDVLVIPNDECRPAWTRYWRRVQNRISGTRAARLSRLAGMFARLPEMGQVFENQLGRENFDSPGTYRLLQLAPQPPDILHCHNLHGNYFDLRVLPWLSHQVPVILNLRDAWLLSGHCAHSFACDRWKTGCGRCPDLSIYPEIKRDATVYNWQRKQSIYDRSRLYITAPSQWLMDQVQASMLRGVQYRVIANAINLAVFRPGNKIKARDALNLPHDARIVSMTAHNQFKDYDTMEAALGRLDKDGNTELIFICLGKNGADRPIGKGHMHYPGFEQSAERMALYYCASDVFIHAATGEAFGKTLTEAMACGTPVVATSIGGIPEQVVDGETGFLVPPFDVIGMTAAIQCLLADESLRLKMGNSAADRAKRFFSLERQVDSFLKWYTEVRQDWLEWSTHEKSHDK